ncbi:sigma-70 family RNA polymerase sigma factor [Pseudomonas typographi]|uniref:Sigma-70 family RNA polymerase sigma factor n=1 Tax=Pseudomonas typographi TaxID=2715964 RepID=A0ABR7YZ01_9PSED|nr:sigma-70 family RNA polymerase sigma factor [Pseudomonas typographi]MBD1550109.1 sigma-70 family RNA polymerase sigma factor [Pseudomonas typographi]MBD1585491.1 sigma-70 family RNA polymerase sigma factor [Pseudomonas typographi]MBD1598397.1 sigma-70 family RNA polymerase sigma factor [Pseudomonas typographi]
MPSTCVHTLYQHHHGWLYHWLRSRLGNSADAADLAQDTFVRVLQKPQRPALMAPRAFLGTIARGLVIDHWRREELRRAYLQSLALLPPAQVPCPQTRELLLELLEQVARMLDGLKPRARLAFLLAQCDGLSHAQIAGQLQVSVRTVERYVADALYRCYLLRYEH